MSDALASLVKTAHYLIAHDYINTSVGCLAIYNHLLTLDDEVSYVWQREKNWISYLIILNRYILLCYVMFNAFTTEEYRHAQCTRKIYISATLGMTMLLFSDILMTTRVYAVTGRNKLIVLCLSSLICAKTIASYYFISMLRTNSIPLPDIPISAFKTCTSTGPNRLLIAIKATAVTFDISLFGAIIWFACSNAVIFRFSSLFKTVMTDATVYFIVATCIQTVVLFFVLFANPTINTFPLVFNPVLIPILINRVVLSLKRTADFNSTANRAWCAGNFSNMRSEMPTTVTSEAIVGQPPTEVLLDTDDHNDIPLDDLTRRERLRLSAGTLGVES